VNYRGTIGFDTLPCLKYIGSKASITAWQDKPEAPSPATSDEEDSRDDMVVMISMTLVMTGVLENTLW